MGVLSFFCIVCIVPNGKIYSHALMMRCPVAAVAAGNLMVRDRWDSVGRQRDAQSCVFCINRCFRSGHGRSNELPFARAAWRCNNYSTSCPSFPWKRESHRRRLQKHRRDREHKATGRNNICDKRLVLNSWINRVWNLCTTNLFYEINYYSAKSKTHFAHWSCRKERSIFARTITWGS